MVRVEYHADLKEVQGDPSLAALLVAEAQPSPFDRLAWWQALAQDCGIKPLLAVARDAQGSAVLPLQAGTGHLHGLANWYSFALRPLASGGAEALPLFAAIARDLRKRAYRVTMAPLPDEGGEAALLGRAFAAAGWRVRLGESDVNHVLDVKGRSFADYLSDRPGPLRTTLKRKSGKVEIQLLQHFDGNIWNEYEEIYRASWKPEEGSPAFLRHFAESEAAAGRLRLGIARHDGRAVAAQFWTVDHGTAYIHKLAHLENARRFSPGTVLSAALFEQSIDRDGVQMIDFGTGNDPYKRDWMERIRPRFRLDALDPAQPRAWPHITRAALQQLAPGARRG